jgi:hypothetical protein
VETRAQKLFTACRIFEGSKYEPVVKELTEAYSTDKKAEFDKLFEKLPTNVQLLDTILEKVKGKKVFSTLKKTVTETVEDNVETLIGLSSLTTHVAIECKTNKEYRALLPDLHAKLGVLIGQV